MGAIWLGVMLAFGFALGLLILWSALRFLYTLRFRRAGCTYESGEKPGTPTGWLTRDPHTADWLLWDVSHSVCLRMADYDALVWGKYPDVETHKKVLKAWAESRGVPLDDKFTERVVADSRQWNISNYSRDQFLLLALEYQQYLRHELRKGTQATV